MAEGEQEEGLNGQFRLSGGQKVQKERGRGGQHNGARASYIGHTPVGRTDRRTAGRTPETETREEEQREENAEE